MKTANTASLVESINQSSPYTSPTIVANEESFLQNIGKGDGQGSHVSTHRDHRKQRQILDEMAQESVTFRELQSQNLTDSDLQANEHYIVATGVRGGGAASSQGKLGGGHGHLG